VKTLLVPAGATGSGSAGIGYATGWWCWWTSLLYGITTTDVGGGGGAVGGCDVGGVTDDEGWLTT